MKKFISANFNHLLAWDAALCRWIYSLNGKLFFDKAFYALSRLGDGPLYVLVGILILVFMRLSGVPIVLSGLTAFTLELTVYKLIKNMVKRNRPFVTVQDIQSLIKPPDRFSFPSGHTAAAVVMSTLICNFFPAFLMPSILFSMLVGFSRIYNGVHFPADIAAGGIIGFISARIGIWLISYV
jgi:undecaprenyl-diphosphatase